MEFGFSLESGVVSYGKNKSSLPLIATFGDDGYPMTFQTNSWQGKAPVGGNIFWNSRFHEFGIIFGMGFGFSQYQTTFKGITDYTSIFYEDNFGTFEEYNAANGNNVSLNEYNTFINTQRKTYQKEFSITSNHSIYATQYNLGYRFKTYKTWRPYFIATAFMTPEMVSKVRDVNQEHPGFESLPNFDFEMDIDVKSQFRLTIGMEWRQLKFYTAITTANEHLRFSEEEGIFERMTALPYNRKYQFDFGVAYRLTKGLSKPEGYYSGSILSNDTENYNFKHRIAKRFELGIVAGINSLIFMEGNESQGDGISFLQLKSEVFQQSANVKREELNVNVTNIWTSNIDARGVVIGGAYFKLKSKLVDLELAGSYTPLNVQMELQEYSATLYRYITPNNTGNYIYDDNSRSFNNDKIIEFNYDVFSIRPTFVFKMGPIISFLKGTPLEADNENYFNNMGLYFGIEKSFYQMSNRFLVSGNTNSLEVHQDLYNVYRGEGAPNDNHYIRFDDEVTYFESDFLEYGNTPENKFTKLSEYKEIVDANPLSSMGYHFGFSYMYRRFDFRIGGGFAKNWSNGSLYGKIEKTLSLSVQYMIFGS